MMRLNFIMPLLMLFFLVGCSQGENISVEVEENSEMSGTYSFTYDCEWIGGGNTIKCSGIFSNNVQDKIIETSPRMVVLSSKECLICSDTLDLGQIQPNQKLDYTLSCTVNNKQDVKIMLLPSGEYWIAKC